LWNSRGHGFKPARFTSFSNDVRRLQFRQPFGPMGFCQMVPAYNMHLAGFGQLKGFFQKRAKVGK